MDVTCGIFLSFGSHRQCSMRNHYWRAKCGSHRQCSTGVVLFFLATKSFNYVWFSAENVIINRCYQHDAPSLPTCLPINI